MPRAATSARFKLLAAIAGVALMAPLSSASAHFRLLSPATTLAQNALGDPQKLAPCGGTSANPGEPTGAVTELTGGGVLQLKIQETVFHPSHYRVALAVNGPAELPADPETTTRETPEGPYSVSAKIEADPKPPLLADGLFPHTEKLPQGQILEAELKVPNIDCEDCTLQVIQWMGEHSYNPDGAYSYHHCATLRIKSDPRLPLDTRWPKAKRARKG
ncbi:SCE4755 family polysaccharide monooxygenase-like protein [Phenylobacterium deserti]|uniref:Chitin-binding type-4 domain-containing protein n=1 Tax=Phenylobacterium deserti TaxID=1914756 RepID=A0A328AJB4_9CAUL|nr:SCE4755 family polysaccharide monooxygenase-like protein [Phenylobacterium deserti]RAK52948.1 hypothetical protein DJ018_12290 [Phenylobacterium deserti]